MIALRTTLACTVALAGSTAVGALAQDTPPPAPNDTSITVSPPIVLRAPALAPADFGGVRTARRGKPLPAGYVAVGHRVTITLGTRRAYPAFTIACPAGKTLRTFAHKPGGGVVVQLVGRSPIVRVRSFDYVGEASWAVIADYNGRTPAGTTLTGTIYGLCR